MASASRAFHLRRGDSWRFALYTAAQAQPAHAALLCLPAWAEEANKTRRAQAQAIALFSRAGFATLQLDLLGCGDSDGELADATWQAWLDDARAGLDWLRHTLPGVPVVGWGLRAGALLASGLDEQLDAQLWWQPAAQGKAVLQQFLRLRLAAEIDRPGQKTSMADLKAALAAGQSLDVAGYTLSATLAQGLEAASLKAPARPTLWLEACSSAPATLLPASQTLIERWALEHLQSQALQDAHPWAATELEDMPALSQASLSWLVQRFAAGAVAELGGAPA